MSVHHIPLDVIRLFLSNTLNTYIISLFSNFTAQPHLPESFMGRGSPEMMRIALQGE